MVKRITFPRSGLVARNNFGLARHPTAIADCTPPNWQGTGYQTIPCDMRKTTVVLDVSVKDARLHLAVLFDLHEQPAVDKLGKTGEER